MIGLIRLFTVLTSSPLSTLFTLLSQHHIRLDEVSVVFYFERRITECLFLSALALGLFLRLHFAHRLSQSLLNECNKLRFVVLIHPLFSFFPLFLLTRYDSFDSLHTQFRFVLGPKSHLKS
jgi:hypothetical protein